MTLFVSVGEVFSLNERGLPPPPPCEKAVSSGLPDSSLYENKE